jgi:hypothetical protein
VTWSDCRVISGVHWCTALYTEIYFTGCSARVSLPHETSPSSAPLGEVNISASKRPSSGSCVSSFPFHSASLHSSSLLYRAKRLFLTSTIFQLSRFVFFRSLTVTHKAVFLLSEGLSTSALRLLFRIPVFLP